VSRTLLFTCLVSANAWATNAALYDAIRLHQEGEFAQAKRALSALAADLQLSDDDRTSAAEFLASSELALKDRDGARATLAELLRRHPDARLDTNLFFPELIALAEEVRIQLDAERRSQAPPLPTVATRAPATTASRRWAQATLIGGGAVLAVAAGLEIYAYTQYAVLTQSTAPAGGNPGPYQSRGSASQVAAQVTAVVGGAALLASGALFLFGAPATATPAVAFDGHATHLSVTTRF
jgi:hypothetical protein